jgi:hypothetical protein
MKVRRGGEGPKQTGMEPEKNDTVTYKAERHGSGIILEYH